MEELVLFLLNAVVFLALLYWLVKKAIDDSVTSAGLEKIYLKLLDIHKELQILNGKTERAVTNTYTLEQVREDLAKGRELEFLYQGAVYQISRGTDSWFLVRPEGDSRFFATHEELLTNAIVRGKRLAEVWPDVEVRRPF